MTIAKKFKARVRERQARTGESYTAARRAIEAETHAPDDVRTHNDPGLHDGRNRATSPQRPLVVRADREEEEPT